MLEDYFKTHIPEFNINNSLLVARPGLIFIAILIVPVLLFWILELTALRNVFLAVLLFVVWFFRDPHRQVPPEGFGLAPADGKIIRVDKKATCPVTGRPSLKISVFMNIFSVHVNRIPTNGVLLEQVYHPGSFWDASLDKASDKNERNSLFIRDDMGREFVMVQIAGLIARRIVSWVEPGAELARGQRCGMIRFGSRVDLYLPPSAIPMVALGQTVKAGWSPLFRYPENREKKEETGENESLMAA
ncbi:MAG: phosphatidylserine decarboxylase family protein [Deltaproteobacteria bacterium]|nr:phosphatidylserine decarboxylase family protein [Deltaproteobacteria bacterium]